MALAGLFLVSALGHWLVVRRINGPWIVPDEGVYAARGIEFWHRGPFALLHGAGAGYGLVYPFVAGIPLSLGRTTEGYSLLKLVQPFLISLTVVPVFVYARRVMPARFALVAAALTVASPLLLYSGFVMSEVVFYPVAVLTLLTTSRAVATGSLRDQAIALVLVAVAVLTRTQAVLFALVLPAAVLVESLLARDLRRLRAFWPSASLGLGAAGLVAIFPGLVGAYSETLRGGYPLQSGLELVVDHLAYLALSVAVAPFAAFVLLGIDAVRRRERNADVRALLAVTAVAAAATAVQVGFFAARYAPHLLGRDLAALPPLFFLLFALWLSRGSPRSRIVTSLGLYATAALILLTHWSSIVVPDAFADSFDLIIVSKLPWAASTSVMVFSVAVLAAVMFVPSRAAPSVLVAITLSTLVASSAVAARELQRVAGAGRLDVVGATPDWIDRAVRGPVAYVYGGEQFWQVVWLERFWNRRIDSVITLGGSQVPGPMPQVPRRVSRVGLLGIRDRYVVAPNRFTFVGTPVGQLAQAGLDTSGLTLWKLRGRPRVSQITNGVQPNGDMSAPATVSVYDCAHGRLELTLLPKASTRLRILLNGRVVVDERIAGLSVWTGVVPAGARTACTYTILPDPLLGSTRIVFSR